MKASQVGCRIRSKASGRRGQNTVEYLLMLSVIVGVVLIAGGLLKNFMPSLFSSIQTMIGSAATSLGSH